MAPRYDAAKDRNAVYSGELTALIARWMPASERTRVLDIGCGTGRILATLAPADGLGIDASAAMIDRARRSFGDHAGLRYEVRDATEADASGPFSAVVSADLLEHVQDWRAVVEAGARACAPGGVIVLTTPNPLWSPILFVLEKLRLKMPEGPHAFVHRRRIAGALRGAGCTIEACGTHLLLPCRLGGLGPRVSAAVAGWPVLRGLGVIQLVVARRRGEA